MAQKLTLPTSPLGEVEILKGFRVRGTMVNFDGGVLALVPNAYTARPQGLEWLGARVRRLQALVETLCKERLSALKPATELRKTPTR